ncbi:hypothetical protein ADK76_30650 [Streptomyces griseoflavus]|uniref:hypothetical protein n=1 Tax=Streptomyces rimosus TaxID=1927 RepID=UPI0004CC85BC|nr:hypothetical protein [Streptomyces rimosus]KOG52804.1 hypothetical protein ADK76_30650 [Streptomyces griseoflavus]
MTTKDHPDEPRLLPWANQDGKPCYVIGEGRGLVSDFADELEELQLCTAIEVLDHSRASLSRAEPLAPTELLFITNRLTESLTDAVRVADSRGRRLNQALHAP